MRSRLNNDAKCYEFELEYTKYRLNDAPNNTGLLILSYINTIVHTYQTGVTRQSSINGSVIYTITADRDWQYNKDYWTGIEMRYNYLRKGENVN